MNKENNKLIAEFMGYVQLPDNRYEITDHSWEQNLQGDSCNYYPEYMCYDINWEWLMPVINRINSMQELFDFEHKYFNISDEGELFVSCHIKDAYEAAVAFIKWYK